MENHTIAAVCLSAILSLAIFGMVVRFLFVRRTRKTDEKNDQEDMESQSQISENDLVILQNLFLECEHRVPIHAVAANVPPPDYVEKTCTFSQACYSLSSSPPSYMDAFENVNKSLSLREKVLTPVFDSEDDEDAKSNSDMSLN